MSKRDTSSVTTLPRCKTAGEAASATLVGPTSTKTLPRRGTAEWVASATPAVPSPELLLANARRLEAVRAGVAMPLVAEGSARSVVVAGSCNAPPAMMSGTRSEPS